MRANTPTVVVGVPEIDAQHQALFDVADQFATAAEEHPPEWRLEELFAFLVEYAMDHFAVEERFMRGIRYPELARHMEEHTLFKRQLAAIVSQWHSEGASPAVVVVLKGFLELWMSDHVATSDRQIGEYVLHLRR